MPETPPAATVPIRVWDLPTRLFHWTLAVVVVGSLVSSQIGGNAMAWHIRLGLLAMALVIFRLLWGLVGGYWSRFASFVHAPSTVLRYLRGQTAPGEHLEVGHNPLGSLSVLAMLGVLALQVATGLVADDEIATVGPLNRFIDSAIASSATSWHKAWGQWLIVGLVVLHVAAIVYYRRRRKKNLVRPMLIGDKPLPAGTPASADGPPQRLLAAVLALACAALAVWIGRL